MKVDIEGAERDVLHALTERTTLQLSQRVIELHHLAGIGRKKQFERPDAPCTAAAAPNCHWQKSCLWNSGARTTKVEGPSKRHMGAHCYYSHSKRQSDNVFVYRGRCGNLIRIPQRDGQGMCLFAKRLGRVNFLWSSAADGRVTMSPARLALLPEGIDWCPFDAG